MSTLVAVVDDADYVDNALDTESCYDTYRIHAGTYPIAFTTTDGRDVSDPVTAHSAAITVQATLIEGYRENRIARSPRTAAKRPRRPGPARAADRLQRTTLTLRFYMDEVWDGADLGAMALSRSAFIHIRQERPAA